MEVFRKELPLHAFVFKSVDGTEDGTNALELECEVKEAGGTMERVNNSEVRISGVEGCSPVVLPLNFVLVVEQGFCTIIKEEHFKEAYIPARAFDLNRLDKLEDVVKELSLTIKKYHDKDNITIGDLIGKECTCGDACTCGA